MLYHSKIIAAITQLYKKAPQPDTTNIGAFLGQIFFWENAGKYCTKQAESAWKELEEAKLADLDRKDAGNYTILEGSKFILNLKVSEPRKTFKTDELIKILQSEHKVSLSKCVDIIERCKTPGNGVKTYTITEKI